jgi:hypothetical protein
VLCGHNLHFLSLQIPNLPLGRQCARFYIAFISVSIDKTLDKEMKRFGWLSIAMSIGLFGGAGHAFAQANPPVVTALQVEQTLPAAKAAGRSKFVPARQVAVRAFKEALKAGAMFTVVLSSSVVAHELGHAAIMALFDASLIDSIHFFTLSEDKASELFSFDKIHVHKGIWRGYVHAPLFAEKYKDSLAIQNMVTLGGVLGAAAFCSFLLTLAMCYCHVCDGNSLTDDVAFLLQKPFKPFQSIIGTKNLTCEQKITLLNFALIVLVVMIAHAFYVLTPNGFLFIRPGSGDGEVLWARLLGSKGTSKEYHLNILRCVSILSELGCLGWLAKCYYDARKQLYAQGTPLVEGVAQQAPIAAVAAA